jgi:hypothetical protein
MNLFDGVELGSEWTPKDRGTHGVITVVGRDGPHVVYKWGTGIHYYPMFPERLFEQFNKVRKGES